MMKQSAADYRLPENIPQRSLLEVVEDAFALAHPSVDFGIYDGVVLTTGFSANMSAGVAYAGMTFKTSNGVARAVSLEVGSATGNTGVMAHELGHSMHSHLTWKNQPYAYSGYSLFVAEVASNFNQAMMRGHLLNTIKDKNFLIALIEEAVGGNFFRYFFQMPTLARFELETHQRAERGEPLTADSMQDLMADLFTEGFGPKVKVDRPRVGMVWSTFSHLFADYYVYQYATGISGAHALSSRILRGEPNAAENYLGFLKSGSSAYPLDVLKKAGVDLTTSKAVEETFAVMEGYIDRLEELVG
jgi:oligoendopeptidase F